ncbi:armadillo-type protein [Coemansia spiralis]|nr:armadillo-type protein [Coemansia spiralis]
MSEADGADVEFSWKTFIQALSSDISTTSVNARRTLLKDKLQPTISAYPLGDRDLFELLVVLRSTIGLYVDKASRCAVLDVLRGLSAKRSDVFVKAIVAVLDPVIESAQPKKIVHPSAIPTTVAYRYALLSWVDLAMTVPVIQLNADAAALLADGAWKKLVLMASRLLWGIAPSAPNTHSTKAHSISSSAYRDVWRTLRACPEMLEPMLTVLTGETNNHEVSVLIGNVVSTAARLQKDTMLQQIALFKDAIASYIDRVIVNSKVPISYSSVADLKYFIQLFVGSDFEDLFKPSISKVLIRSPEVALPTCLWLLETLDKKEIDMAELYLDIFADQIASNLLKSTNAGVRQSAADLFKYLANTPQTNEAATKAAEVVTEPLIRGRYAQPEHRVLFYNLLGKVHAGADNGWASAVVILGALLKMTTKETQEAPVNALFSAIGQHVGIIINHLASVDNNSASGYKECEEALKAFSEAAQKGLVLPERSAAARHGWAADAIGEPLWNSDAAIAESTKHPWMAAYIHPLLKILVKSTGKATASPLTTSGGVLDAHVGLALTLRTSETGKVPDVDAKELVDLVINTEKSLVLWDKVYHKCVGLRESAWILRSASMLYAYGCDDQRLASLLLWIICHLPDPDRQIARFAISTISSMSQANPSRLWALVESCLFEEMSASLESSESNIYKWLDILNAATSGISSKEINAQTKIRLLVSMALVAHHPAILRESRRDSFWIALIQRAGIDPGELCHDNLSALKQCVRQSLLDSGNSSKVNSATNLVKDLVFIGGESVALRLLEFAYSDIDPVEISSITCEEIAVWRTPVGQLYFDPIEAKKRTQGLPKSGKSKDDVWAEQLQEEIARKKNIARKLTKEEYELVDKQKAKEDAMRKRVEHVHSGLHRGLTLIRAVVCGSASVASASMLVLVRIVIERAIIGGAKISEELAGPEILETLLAMSKVADGLEDALRIPITMGLLRARGFESIVPRNWKQESMENLATRLYYRLRISCESSPLSPAGFNFLLPFMQITAEIGGWGQKTRKGIEEHDEYAQLDNASEQLVMIVSILSFHAHFGNVEEMPRKEMLELMVLLMSTQPVLLSSSRDSMIKMAEEMEGTDTPLERDALLDGLVQPDSAVRNACLAALDFADLTELDYSAKLWLNAGGKNTDAVALQQNAQLSLSLWSDNGMEILPGLISDVILFLNNKSSEIRDCGARSIALAIHEALELIEQGEEESEMTIDDVQRMTDIAINELLAAYRKWYISLDPEYDEFGIIVPGTQNRVDIAEARVAVADALYHLVPLLTTSAQVKSVIQFLVGDRVLGERAESVRTHMLSAGARAVTEHGSKWSSELMPILEQFLLEKDEGTASYDYIREGVVVLLGRLAQHLPSSEDARVADAVDQLIVTLSTPSESVQSAVSECLPPLSKRISEEKFEAIIEQIMDTILNSEKYSQRRGGAYGLAGMIKGRGLAALKKFKIVDQLRAACENKKAYQQRQGALFAYETLSGTMGRLFEPYIIQFIPVLLAMFGDSNTGVREAALDTARVIMSNISGHGVKLILPSALAGLDNDQWRTKKGSVEMLGAMAYCAPKQLSISLPTTVPCIINVLTDTHGQVSEAARQALLRFGEVIHNPEIQELVPTLLAALDDPANKTDPALRTLLYTAFIHYIDAPSLALVIPILQRGMRARNASTKRNAAQIMGSMATLTDPKDLVPYLESLVPLLRSVLIDPVPEARATAAKALGSLVQKLGEEQFPSLVADLIKILKSDASGVDRAGAAQGLSEVLSGIGIERLEGLLPEILANCNSARVQVREGFMMLLIYLPTTFGEGFQRFLTQVISPVLSGLADENEQVRSAALRAGRILVVSYSNTAVDILLPELLAAMHHEIWRIRQSSIELLGELLYRIAGISGKQAEKDREAARALFFAVQDGEGDEGGSDIGNNADENEEVDHQAEEEAAISSNLREVLNQNLGLDRCQSVLAALYVTRNDVSAMVRQASFTVWKSIVNNTPRTVRECLPGIMDIVLVGLSSEDFDRRTAAARTLGDLVHKLGEAVMSRVVPILKKALINQPPSSGSSESSGNIRHGVFIGLSEILHSTGKAYIEDYADAMIPLVRRGLCDEDANVREAAASAFNALQQSIGPRAIDSVVPPLLNALTQKSPDEIDSNDALAGINAEYALEALRELMAVRANVVFPVLIPTLTAVPVSTFNARALSSLIQVSGGNLSKRLSQILDAVFESLPVHHAADNKEAEDALRETVRVIVASASQDEDTLETLMMKFHELVKIGDGIDLTKSLKAASRVAEACFAMEGLCKAFGPNSASRGRSVLGSHVVDWLRILIDFMASSSPLVVQASWTALDALCKTIPKEDYDGYVGPVSRAVQHATDSLPKSQETLPGFDLPKGVGPILPIYSQGLLAGSPDTKERAVRGMARLVKFTDPAALRLFATGITGPLIRIVGDRHPANVKAAILSTLGLLLIQIPALMRPFLPQLQRTFVRGLSEQDDIVRQRAATALAALIPLQARLDPLVSELTTGVKQADNLGMRLAMMKAVCAVFKAPGAKSLSPASVQAIESMIIGRGEFANVNTDASDTRWRSLRSNAFGGLCSILPEEAASKLVAQYAIAEASDSGSTQAMKLGFLAAVLLQSPDLIVNSSDLQKKIGACVNAALSPNGDVQQAQAALQATSVAKNALMSKEMFVNDSSIAQQLCQALVRVVDAEAMAEFDSDVQQSALAALKSLAKHRYSDVIEPIRDNVVQAAMTHVRDRNITVKLAAERCVLYALRLARMPLEAFDGSEDGLKSYVMNVGGPTSEKGKQVLDYQRRVLNKLAEATRELDYASDDEDDEEGTDGKSVEIDGDDEIDVAT